MTNIGDNILNLPIDNKNDPKKSDYEIIYNIFSEKNTKNLDEVVDKFKLSIVATILFCIFSLPFIEKIIDIQTRGNTILTKIILLLTFMLTFYLVQKLLLKY
jgi:hypothetical protein